jgi:hypothetical protein
MIQKTKRGMTQKTKRGMTQKRYSDTEESKV